MKHRIVFTILMSFVLSIFMSLWVTWINLGWSDALFGQWMTAFRLAWPAAAVISFITGPTIQTLTPRIARLLP